MKILSVVGARPQFIKAAPVSRVLRQSHHEVLLHTGQHYDDEMSDVFFRELQVPQPDYNLGVGSGSHGFQTGSMLMGIEKVALAETPDWMLVYGDTNSTLAGALAAAKLHLPLAHVEAGLRSYDRRMPEEVNRVLTDHVSDLCFCPTTTAVSNLASEGIRRGVFLVGDVMYDVYEQEAQLAEGRSRVLADLGLLAGGYVLATVHRAENVDDPSRLRVILDGLQAARSQIVFPIHPRTRAAVRTLGWTESDHVRLTDPVGYLDMLVLERHARTVVTDSGGVQKEAYFAGTPCVTLRDRTEWTETVSAGWNTLVPVDRDAIAGAIASVRPAGERPMLFGDGHAAEKIVTILSRGLEAARSIGPQPSSAQAGPRTPGSGRS